MNSLCPVQDRIEETILIIEDEPTERMLTRAHLEQAGYKVIEADDAPAGLELAHKVQPDLIILDINLPTTNGFEVCKSLRATPSLRQTPILISTGLDDTESVAEGFIAGASDFLTKPIIWGLLSYRVKFLLRGARVEQELANANRLAHANAIALAENERHYRDLFNHAPVMMHRIDPQFQILNVNQSWLAKTGYQLDEVIGQDFAQFTDDRTKERFETNGRQEFIDAGNVIDRPCRIRRKDGTLIDVLLTSTGSFDGDRNFLGAHTVLLDVTERIRAERKMREAQETAEAASRAKSVFLATMSHEIRTPLNGVIGMIDLLEHTELNSDQVSMITTVRDSAYSLLRIIGDILDFSKIEAGELIIEQIDTSIVTVVEGVIDTLLPLAREKSIELTVFMNPRIPELVSSDPVRIRQILFNLVGNAIKFSERKDGTTAKVSVEADLVKSETASKPVLRFTVSDTGMGISKKHLARLFTPFFQAEDSTVRRFGGTGLGLSICRNLVDLMSGKISAESEVGAGSTFTVDLPLIAAKAAASGKAERLLDLRILLVALEDDAALAVRNYLAYEGAQITEIGTLKEAKEAFATAANADAAFDIAVFSHSRPQAVDAENAIVASLGTEPECHNTRFILFSEDRRNRTRAALPACTIMPKQPISRTTLMQAMLDAAGRPNTDVAQTCAPKKAATFRQSDEPVGGLILLAEDNTVNQLVIQRQLRQFGYIADVAADGSEAFDAYRRGGYKLLLTDCHMPEMDGFELAQAIREKERGTGERLPIIAITANAVQGEADRCLNAGMDGYLSKPVELAKLGSTLDQWLDNEAIADTAETSENEAANPDEMDAGNPIDLDILSRLLGTEDDAYIREMVTFYWDTMRETSTELSELLSSRDAPKMRDAAHAAKGASASVGAVPVASLLEKLQFAAADADWTRIEGLIPRIETEFTKLGKYIDTLEAA